MIKQLQVENYSREPRPSWTEVFDQPDLELVLAKLTSMDRHHQPLLFLCKSTGDEGTDVMEVMGGDGLYFIEVANDKGFWFTPYNPLGSGELIDIWTSNEGWSVQAKYTWPLDDTQTIVEHYFTTGRTLSTYAWRSVKHM